MAELGHPTAADPRSPGAGDSTKLAESKPGGQDAKNPKGDQGNLQARVKADKVQMGPGGARMEGVEAEASAPPEAVEAAAKAAAMA
jgi:hypothetical protein